MSTSTNGRVAPLHSKLSLAKAGARGYNTILRLSVEGPVHDQASQQRGGLVPACPESPPGRRRSAVTPTPWIIVTFDLFPCDSAGLAGQRGQLAGGGVGKRGEGGGIGFVTLTYRNTLLR